MFCLFEKTKINEKEAGDGPFLKKIKKPFVLCTGYGSAGRMVASNTRDSNPVIGKYYLLSTVYLKTVLKTRKYRKKSPAMVQYLHKTFVFTKVRWVPVR